MPNQIIVTQPAPIVVQVKQVGKTQVTTSATAAAVAGTSANAFGVVNVAGQNNVVADASSDTLTLVAGTGIVLTTNSVSDSITVAATGGSAFDQFARDHANGAFDTANSAYNQANTATTNADAAFAHANSAYSNANSAIYTAAQIRANISNTAPVNYDPSTGIISHAVSGVTATTYGNTTFVPTITVDSNGHVTNIVNTAIALPPSFDQFARDHANGAFDQANTANVTGQAAFDKANSGFTLATTANTVAASAYNQANIATTNADAAFAKANTANVTGQAAFDKANGAVQTGFVTINVAGQANVVADSNNDMLTLVAGSGVTITTDAPNDIITISSTGGSGADQYARNIGNNEVAFIYSNVAGNGFYTSWSTLYSAYQAAGSPIATIGFYQTDIGGLLTIPAGFYNFALGSKWVGLQGSDRFQSFTIVSFADLARIGGVVGFENLTLQSNSTQPVLYLDSTISGDPFNYTDPQYISLTKTVVQSLTPVPFLFANTSSVGLQLFADSMLSSNAINTSSMIVTIYVQGGLSTVAANAIIGEVTSTITISRRDGWLDLDTTEQQLFLGTFAAETQVSTVGLTANRPTPIEKGYSWYDDQISAPIWAINSSTWKTIWGFFSGSAPISFDNSTGTFSHATSGVVADGYGDAANIPVFVVDDTGHLTSVTNTAIAISATQITSGTLAVGRGGTGQTAASLVNGAILLGNTVSGGYDLNTLTQGTGIVITNDKGSVTIAATGGSAIDQFARDHANGAFGHANGAFDKANTANVTGQAAFDKANSGFTLATTANTVAASAYNQANIATTNADAAFAKANSANVTGQAAFDKANGAVQTGFVTINVAGQANVVADSNTDMLTLVAGSGVTITTDAPNDIITISSAGGSGADQYARNVGNNSVAFVYSDVAANGVYTDWSTLYAAYQAAGSPQTTLWIQGTPANIPAGTWVFARNSRVEGTAPVEQGQLTFDDQAYIKGMASYVGLNIVSYSNSAIVDIDGVTTPGDIFIERTQIAVDGSIANRNAQFFYCNTVVGSATIHLGKQASLSANTINVGSCPVTYFTIEGEFPFIDSTAVITTTPATELRFLKNGPGSHGLYYSGLLDFAGIVTFFDHVDEAGDVSAYGSIYPANGAMFFDYANDQPMWANNGVWRSVQGLLHSTANGQTLIGNTVSGGFDVATLTQGTGIAITNDKGTITIAATGGSAIDQFARDHSNGAFDKANTANTTADAAYNQANTANVTGQAAFDKANSGFTLATTANTVAASAYNQANIATTNADAAFAHANGAFDKANTANVTGQAAFDKANSAIYTAAQIRANISNTYPVYYDATTGVVSFVPATANGQTLIGNTVSGTFDVSTLSQGTGVTIVNGKGTITLSAADVFASQQANAAFDKANTANVTGQAAFDKANSGFTLATTANTVAASAYNQANIATTNADAAFARANAAYANANTAIYTAAQIRANISNTTPILYDPSTGIISLTTVPVTLGGTGYTSYSNGDLLIGNTMSGGLDRANLTQGFGIIITNSNGRITLDAAIGKTYYLVLSQASDVATYNVASIVPSANAEVNTSVIYTGTSYSLAASFLTAPGEPGTTLLPAGTYGRHFHATTDGLNNEGQLRVDLYKYAANTLETLLRSNESPIFNSGDADALLLNWNITDPVSYALEETDRLLFKVYVRRVSGGSGSVRVTVFYEGTSRASYIPTTILTAGTDAFARLQANAAYNHANGAFGHANGAYNKANVATTNADAAFAQANAAYANANTAIYTAAQIRANISASLPISYSSATGVISLPATANGQTLIGNTVSGSFDVALIAQTAPVIVTNEKGTVTLSHASSGVTAAVYGNGSIIPSITIDAFGHITGAVNTAVAIDGSQVTSGTLAVARGGTGQSSYTNGQILIGNTGSTGLDKATIAQSAPVIVTVAQGLITLSHARSGVTAVDSYGSAAIVPVFAVDANGHLTAVVNTSIAISAAAVTSGILSVARGGTGKDATGLTNGQILIGNTVNTGFDLAAITQTAPVIVSTDQGSIRLSHARSGVTATSYGSASLIPVITVDDNGHITSATTAAASGLPAATANGQTLIGNTVSGSFDVALIAQTAPIIVTNGKGTINLSHASSGVVAAIYGNGTFVPVLTVDTFGHITAAAAAAITGTGAIIKQNTISIGATAVESIEWVVTDASVTAGSFITGSIAYVAQTGKELDEMEMDQIDLKFAPAAGSFTVYATGLSGMISGNFTFNYTIY